MNLTSSRTERTSQPIPYQIVLGDFAIIEVNGAGFWVRRLTKSGKLAQRAQHNGAPVAFILYPVIAVSEWRYVSPRPTQVQS